MVSAVKTFDYIISAFISSILQHILFDSLFHWIVPVCYYRWGMTCNSSFFAFASVLLHFCTSCEKLAGDEMFFNIFKKMTIDEGALACLECSQRQWKIIISSVAYEYSCIKVVLKKTHFFRPGLNFINVLWAAFTLADPKCTKKDSQVGSVVWHFWELRA